MIIRKAFLLAFFMLSIRGTQGKTRLKVKMLSYFVDGSDWDGYDCDYWLQQQSCDLIFTFCVDETDGDNSMSNCKYWGPQTTSYYYNEDYIEFESDMEGISNPLDISISDAYEGSFKLKVLIMDKDWRESNDRVDKIVYTYIVRPARSAVEATYSNIITAYGKRPQDESWLMFRVLLYCEANYFGKDCSVYCKAADDNARGHYTCNPDTGLKICRPGWETPSENCRIKEDDCEHNLCENGATCVDHYKGYSCHCVPGYTGIHCEIEINECLSAPCRNGGSCFRALNSFSCKCPPEFTGRVCEYHVCEANDFCHNGGTCIDDDPNNVTCICPASFTGKLCDVNKCDIITCMNGGVCKNGSCECPSDFLGSTCEISICDHISCEHGGTCRSGQCLCPEGYTGKFCHININDCVGDPCLNEGTCYDDLNGYTCRCLSGFNGVNCEHVLTPNRNDSVSEFLNQRPSPREPQSKGWMTGLVICIIALILIVGIAIVIFYRRKWRKRQDGSLSPIINSDHTQRPDHFNNPLYNENETNAVTETNNQSVDNIPTTSEKVAFDNGNAMVAPPPYSPPNQAYLENGAVGKPPKYTSRGASADVESENQPPSIPDALKGGKSNEAADNHDNINHNASTLPHYDRPKAQHYVNSPQNENLNKKNGDSGYAEVRHNDQYVVPRNSRHSAVENDYEVMENITSTNNSKKH